MKPPFHIVILGATGQVGTAIRDAIARLQPDWRVTCTTRGTPPPGDEWLQFDPFDNDWAWLGQPDLIVNAIGKIRPTRDMSFERVHIGLTNLMLGNRAKLGHPRLLQISALGADPKHDVPFLTTKGQADAVLLSAPETVIVRPSIVCSPGTMLQRKLRQLVRIGGYAFGKVFVPKGFPETRVQPILAADLGDLVVRLAAQPEISGVVEAVGPEPLAFGELLQMQARTMQKQVKLVPVSREIMEGFVRYFLSVWAPKVINYDQFRLLFRDNVGSYDAFERIVGRQPASTRQFWQPVPFL